MSNISWNKYHEHLLKKWSQMSKTYSIMHSLCAQYYSKWNRRLGIPVVILGAVTASSIFGNTHTENSSYINYINGSLALFVTALSGINNFLGTSEKQVKHQTASFKYTSISMEIDTLLSFIRSDRSIGPQEFIREQKSRILEVRENVHEVLPWIMSEYLNKYDKSLTNVNSNINNSFSIQIPNYLQYEEDKNRNTPNKNVPYNTSNNTIYNTSNKNVPYNTSKKNVPYKNVGYNKPEKTDFLSYEDKDTNYEKNVSPLQTNNFSNKSKYKKTSMSEFQDHLTKKIMHASVILGNESEIESEIESEDEMSEESKKYIFNVYKSDESNIDQNIDDNNNIDQNIDDKISKSDESNESDKSDEVKLQKYKV
jgi:hypothetical protein